MTTPPLVTQREYEALVRRLMLLEQRVGRVEVRERGEYSFGSFAPTLAGATIAGTFTYNATTAGTYTRLGNLVTLRGRISISAVTVAPTGNLRITGLPLPATTVTSGSPGALTFTYWGLIGIGGGAKVHLAGWIQSGQTRADLAVSDSAGGAAVFLTGAVAAVAANTDLVFTGQYEV